MNREENTNHDVIKCANQMFFSSGKSQKSMKRFRFPKTLSKIIELNDTIGSM